MNIFRIFRNKKILDFLFFIEVSALILSFAILFVSVWLTLNTVNTQYLNLRMADAEKFHLFLGNQLDIARNNFENFINIPENELSPNVMTLLSNFSDIYRLNEDLRVERIYMSIPGSRVFKGFSFSIGKLENYLRNSIGTNKFSEVVQGFEDEKMSIYYALLKNSNLYLGRLHLNHIQRFLAQFSQFSGTPLLFTSNDGFVMASSNPELQISTIDLKQLKQKPLFDRTVSDGKQEWFSIISDSENIGAKIVLLVPLDLLNTLYTTMMNFMTFFMGVLLLLVFVKNRILNQFLIKPISSFMLKLQDVEKGQVRIDEVKYRFVELTVMNTYFKSMAKAIHDREQNLKESESRLIETNKMLMEKTSQAEALAVEAKNASLAKGEFLANMSHELRTPMNAIIGFSNLVMKTELSRKQQDYLSKIELSAKSLRGLINDILDFSKIEAGKLEMESIDFNLEDVVNTVASMVFIKASEKEIEFLNTIKSDVPIHLNGDPLRLEQILTNLSNNAVKFTKSGYVCIKTDLIEKDANYCRLSFSVSDTGIGMSDEQISKLFNAFLQADSSITRQFGGTGLGLTISKRLVEMMNGEIIVKSELGKGSIFSFTARFAYKETEQKKNYIIPEELKGLNVLIVDDNQAALEIYEQQVNSLGFNVTTVDSGEKAIKEIEKSYFEERPYELVLMDYKMPEMDGIETTFLIRQNKLIKHIPLIIMISAFARDEVIKDAKTVGIKDFLMKPVNESLLFNTIMEVFGHKTPDSNPMLDTPVSNTEMIKNAKALLVEDNELNQQVAAEILISAGLIVEIANNGQEAVEAVNKSEYDIVLMDVHMPIMGGYEASNIIRQNKRFKDLPIIAMTAHAISGAKETCLAAGMNDYISKPIDNSKLFSILMKWIKPGIRELSQDSKHQVEKPEDKNDLIDFPNILDGIDIQSGLTRLNGNKRLFKELLIGFAKKYATISEEIRSKLEQGNLSEAELMIHNVKGIAGNIAANEIFAIASEFELAVKTKQEKRSKELLSDFDKALKSTLSSLKILEPSCQNAPLIEDRPIDIEKIKPIMIELYNLIKNDNSDALDIVKLFKESVFDSRILEDIRQLDDQINNFDFPNALNSLNQIAQKMNINIFQ